MPIINVLGLDGSLQNFGMAVATVNTDSNEIIEVKHLVLSKTTKDTKAKRAEDDFERFRSHWLEINNQIQTFKVTQVFGEIPSGSRDVRAAFAFGGVTAILSGLSVSLPVVTVTPTQVKVAATGQKFADKEDVIEAMYSCFPYASWITSNRPNGMNIRASDGKYLTNANEHLADACGVILAGLAKERE